MSDWLNLNVVVPTIAMIVIIVGVLVICIAVTRRRIDMRNGPKDVYCRFTDGYLPRRLEIRFSSHQYRQQNFRIFQTNTPFIVV